MGLVWVVLVLFCWLDVIGFMDFGFRGVGVEDGVG